MKVYHVDDSQNWNIILDKYREALLNEEYTISSELQEILGRGAVLSFCQSLASRKTSLKKIILILLKCLNMMSLI